MMEKKDKKSFIIHADLLNSIEMMSDEEAGKMLRAIKAYWDDEDYDLPRELKFAFLPIKQHFDRDWQAYVSQTQKNRENGAKGGRPKKNPKNPSGFSGNPKKPDNDNGNVKDKGNKDISTEPIVGSIPTNKTDETFNVTESFADEMQKLYPAVNVRQEVNKMIAWSMTNQSKRKTYTGMPKFINNWLSRQQDKGGQHATSGQTGRKSAGDINDDWFEGLKNL